jgi:hypothetical protein
MIRGAETLCEQRMDCAIENRAISPSSEGPLAKPFFRNDVGWLLIREQIAR